jgi:hypothetical protein
MPIPTLFLRCLKQQHPAGHVPEPAAAITDPGYRLHILFAKHSVPADDFRVADHDLMSDVHPQVSEIKEHVQNVEEAVSPEKS